ncbi:ComF family protein [Collibacillus ludicampi]|nr:ComF family protein [Collibacillus ludicampi]
MNIRLWWETFLGLLYPAASSCLVCSGPIHSPRADRISPPDHMPMLCPTCKQRLTPIEPPLCMVCGRHLERVNRAIETKRMYDTHARIIQDRVPSADVQPVRLNRQPTEPQWETSEIVNHSGMGDARMEQRKFEPSLRCRECYRQTSFVFSRSYGAYRDELREILHRYKFMREKELLPLLAGFLCTAWDMHMAAIPCDFLVPVPIHPQRLRERGFNQAYQLAQELSGYSKIPLLNPLRRDIHLTGQAMKTRKERLLALQGVFSVEPFYVSQLSGKTILLIDDIYTTGSTAEACSRVLLEAGVGAVYVLTVAR